MGTVVSHPARSRTNRGRLKKTSPEHHHRGDWGNDMVSHRSPPMQHFSHETQITRMDRPLLLTTVILLIFGLIAVYTASASQSLNETGHSFWYVGRQGGHVFLGLAGMMLLSRVNFQLWRRLAYILAFTTIGLLILTLLIGSTANGSERWLSLPGGIRFQPSEFAKLSTVSLMALAVSRQRLFNGYLFINLALIGAMIALVYLQPNLSLVIILSTLTTSMLFVAGTPIHIFLLTLPPMVYFIFQKIQTTDYLKRRIDGWLDPWKDPMDTGYNLIQSYYAIGSGGIFGQGLGSSVQKLYYLPFQHTDFIFAVICEELGLFGSLTIVGLFALFAWRGFIIAFTCPSLFGQMLAFGITTSIVLQAAINICVTTGIMPVTGVTLPLISYGGSSVIITLCMIGILLNISRYRLKTKLSSPSNTSPYPAF